MTRHKKEDALPPEVEGEQDIIEEKAPEISSLMANIDVLKAQLEEQTQVAEEEHNRHLRALADFANYRRRREEEFQRHLEFANQELILKLLPVIDNFERAAQAAEENHNLEGLAEGVKLTLRQFRDLLEREGVQPIAAVGQEFDPMRHEAVMRVESDEYPENTVVEEVEKGYALKDKVIRPARVAVSAKG